MKSMIKPPDSGLTKASIGGIGLDSITGDTHNALQATTNLKVLCKSYLPDRHSIEVVDVYSASACALAAGVFMTPTLIKIAPLPTRRIVGTLSQLQVVLQALDLDDIAT
jgi:circadian clock protein KaiB